MQALLYIDFNRVGFFTLVGGVKIIDLKIEKRSVETMDYVKDFRILIEGSGVKSVDITTQGLIDPKLPFELYQKFYTAIEQGTKLLCRLVKTENVTLEGDFIVQNLSSSMPHQETETFNLEFLSTGKITNTFS